MVKAILDYRNAKAARDIHNQDVTAMAKNPELVTLWKEMYGES